MKDREPFDYVIGSMSFLGCAIDLSLRPFIPRPETEYWVGNVIEEMKALRKKQMSCLDLFAGSGCIGIALLKNLPNVRVDFAEKEERFVKQIAVNARLNGIPKDRCRIIRSVVFSRVGGVYDYIFANPPYVAEKKRSSVGQSVLDNEPHTALFAGPDGLRYIRALLKEAKAHLKRGGQLVFEFSPEQREKIAALLTQYDYSACRFLKDQYGRWRYVIAER